MKLDNRYEVRHTLGYGASSQVYFAWDELLNRGVAVKQYVDEGESWSQPSLRQFTREVKMAASLQHKNLAALYSVGKSEQGPFLVMEFVEGKSLADHLRSHGALALGQALDVFSQICSAIECLHSQGIIHRDLKPQNVMLTKDTEGALTPKVIDLGLAKNVQRTTQSLTATQTGLAVGTPSYMSPEQCAGQHADQRSDLFALGAILYEMVSAERAFAAEDPMTAMVRCMSEDPTPLGVLRSDLLIPDAVENIALRALCKNPKDRYQSVEQMRTAVDAVMHALNSGGTLPTIARPPKSVYAGAPSKPFIAPKLAVPLAVVAAIALVGAWVMVHPSAPRTDDEKYFATQLGEFCAGDQVKPYSPAQLERIQAELLKRLQAAHDEGRLEPFLVLVQNYSWAILDRDNGRRTNIDAEIWQPTASKMREYGRIKEARVLWSRISQSAQFGRPDSVYAFGKMVECTAFTVLCGDNNSTKLAVLDLEPRFRNLLKKRKNWSQEDQNRFAWSACDLVRIAAPIRIVLAASMLDTLQQDYKDTVIPAVPLGNALIAVASIEMIDMRVPAAVAHFQQAVTTLSSQPAADDALCEAYLGLAQCSFSTGDKRLGKTQLEKAESLFRTLPTAFDTRLNFLSGRIKEVRNLAS